MNSKAIDIDPAKKVASLQTSDETGSTFTGAFVIALLALAVVLVAEPFTMPGFAHGLFYVPILIGYFLFEFNSRKTWVLVGVSISFILLGWLISAPAISTLTSSIVFPNRLLSVISVLAAGILCQRTGRLMAPLLENTFESITDMLFTVNGKWELSYINSNAAKILGLERDGLAGKSLWDICPRWRGGEPEKKILSAVETKTVQQYVYFSEDLQTWFECHIYPMDDGLVIYCKDINEQRQMEDQLQKAQRMESIGLLTGGIAHDFNNLLTVILGNTESLKDNLGDDAYSVKLLNLIEKAASDGAELVQQLLAFARRQPLKSESTDINSLIGNIEGLIKRSVSRTVAVEFHLSDTLWSALIDRFQLESALINMCVNAMQAMPDGGRLLIETCNEAITADKSSSVEGVNPGEYVRVSISDDGHGIDNENIDKIFDPFFTTKELGTGLGLSTIYGFVKQSGGDISVFSETGRGTTFNIYLPRSHKTPPQQPVETGLPAPGGSESVLVVEDNDEVRDYACKVLSEAGYQVCSAANGKAAIERLKKSSAYQLLFTDVIMPGGVNGPELAELAQKLNSDLKVLFTSGYTANATTNHGSVINENAFLKKPYQIDQLLCAVRTTIDSRKQYLQDELINEQA